MAKILDPTEHYPMPVLHAKRFMASGLTLGCTHTDCRWVLDRHLTQHEGEHFSELVELFALFHPHGGADPLDLPIPYALIEQPVVTVRDVVKVGDCPCPSSMAMKLRKIYYPECPTHGELA
jgi:hypothetical protein